MWTPADGRSSRIGGRKTGAIVLAIASVLTGVILGRLSAMAPDPGTEPAQPAAQAGAVQPEPGREHAERKSDTSLTTSRENEAAEAARVETPEPVLLNPRAASAPTRKTSPERLVEPTVRAAGLDRGEHGHSAASVEDQFVTTGHPKDSEPAKERRSRNRISRAKEVRGTRAPVSATSRDYQALRDHVLTR
jgi:hypothetical protein